MHLTSQTTHAGYCMKKVNISIFSVLWTHFLRNTTQLCCFATARPASEARLTQTNPLPVNWTLSCNTTSELKHLGSPQATQINIELTLGSQCFSPLGIFQCHRTKMCQIKWRTYFKKVSGICSPSADRHQTLHSLMTLQIGCLALLSTQHSSAAVQTHGLQTWNMSSSPLFRGLTSEVQ